MLQTVSPIENVRKKGYAEMVSERRVMQILECHLNLLNVILVGGYLPDRVINLILQYLNNSISKSNMYNLLQPRLDIILFEIIFPLMHFSDNDQKLWEEDPHEYVRKGYDIIEDLYSTRIAAMDNVSELVRKRGKENLQNHVGHLRAKGAWVAGQYAHIDFSDPNSFRKALHSVVTGMCDPDLHVRVEFVFALRLFVEACKYLNKIQPILPQLLDEFFKLMNEVENEDLVFTLEIIVDKFGEEMAPYALGLCQNLAAAFWKCINMAEEGDDPGALAAVGCLRAISTILESDWAIDLFPKILVPLDNYISRSTAHFLTYKYTNYQQSLWNMISSVIGDKNLEDGVIEPTPKVIQVVFQHCKGQVDHWAELYIRITIERLRRYKKPYLKCLLVQVIADTLYYNAPLILNILQKLGIAT
ncbi:hypothetical protein RND71_006583 [Anisodus tanguticus]|uniref:Uncharacterized protein n=1 Tax=Anisodus tanguticus TaxID=243964 RepID=A0AAE1SWD6_9SOLA|nr:hypothetical protein RND71_006583 [Anisodus tanguticus]